ncbi:pyruvate dehydrogenase E1 component alpha subunit [Cryobacterium mesophilum]|uniref:Pyruvate dehydrogenase E1 component subunit alpha n=1 Tax=Terrimesophilobacter mesophilus TaxID=433647 RepID=A0A4R8VC29_9MICO|nr:pyruvate dehydrogenase (acetyl-transferring) E1 component subunit alpha [Terrimesophilobacter mesophilus]MBB5633519.1 pyruvate dehydrogenase E1 component alpha subunit [Terrimesophilobacter mesophilus]TFB80225.1 pyruvate dehydrogenase (acetyl-transferring) E1 component subunit alpha [Terrimesophilobacter mesophilus]
MADTRRPAGARRTAKQGGDSAETLRGYYEQMVLVREFELRASEMYARAKIGGYCHLNLGEEATVVGLLAALRDTDYLFTTYRDHGYALVRGMEPGAVMAELFGKTTGVVGGRGGSMHMFDADLRMLGGYGIVGGQIPPATGAAFAIDYRSKAGKNAEAVMCLMGDATTNIGAFHESLNLAGLWKLPIVYVIVNNRLGMGTPVELASAEPDLYKRGSAYRIPGVRVDGDDPVAVRDAAIAALDKARADRQPSILETMSFRLKGHSVVDPARYRSKEDNEEAQANDPVPAFRNRLLKAGALDEKTADGIHDAIEKRVTDAVDFADASPDPSPSELFDAVYATPVANESRAYPGDPVTTVESVAS